MGCPRPSCRQAKQQQRQMWILPHILPHTSIAAKILSRMSPLSGTLPACLSCHRCLMRLVRKLFNWAIRALKANQDGVGRYLRWGSSTRRLASSMTGRYNWGNTCTESLKTASKQPVGVKHCAVCGCCTDECERVLCLLSAVACDHVPTLGVARDYQFRQSTYVLHESSAAGYRHCHATGLC